MASRNRFLAYPLAGLISIGFLGLRWLAADLLGDGNWFIQSYPAVALSAALGGLGPGLLATAIGAAGSLYFFIPPAFSFQLAGPSVPPLITFIVMGALISALNERSRHYTRRLKRAEQRYRQLIDMTPVAVFVNLENRIVYANAAMCRMMQAKTLTGESPVSLVHPDYQDRVDDRIRLMSTGVSSFVDPLEEVWVRKDGTPVTVEAKATVVPWGDRQAIQVVLSDVTEQRRVAGERERLLRLSEEANAAKDDFLASLSHELRTPLNAIIGWARMLRQQVPGVSLDHALQVIERNADTQARLVSELLDLSQITTQTLHVSRETIDLRDPVAAASDALVPIAQAANIDIRLTTPGHQVLVQGDTVRLQQVTWNLVTNAIKFSKPGDAVRIQLAVRGPNAVLTVDDDGQGISPEFLPHVFERFRHEDAQVTRATSGLGVGLSIVQHIVQAHDGTIEALSSGRSQGATFIVTLPRTDARRGAANQNGIRTPALTERGTTGWV